MDRDETLRRAEKLLRQGRLDAAIAEYARLAEEQPGDWAMANLLGDLHVRAGQIEQAVAQYARIAEHLAREGFVAKASALYKKIVKIQPDDDAALRRTAELSAQQGLTADARMQLQALFQQRLRRGDAAAAAEAARAYANIDPADPAGRFESARMFADLGDPAGAAGQWRAAGETFLGAGKVADAVRCWRAALEQDPSDAASRDLLVKTLVDTGDLDAAREAARSAEHWRAVAGGLTRAGRDRDALDALDQAIAADPGDLEARVQLARAAMARQHLERAREVLAPVASTAEPAVQFALAEIEFRTGDFASGRDALRRCLAGRDDLVAPGIELGCDIGPGSPEIGFAVVETVVRFAEAGGDSDLALDALERFLAVVPGHVAALEALIDVCGQTFYEHQRYRAQVQLADAHLALGNFERARLLAEQLIVARPDDPSHVQRLGRAMAGLGFAGGEDEVRSRVRRLTSPEDAGDFGLVKAPPALLAEDLSEADMPAEPSAWATPVPSSNVAVTPPDDVGLGPEPAGAPAVSGAAPPESARDAATGGGSTGAALPDREVFEIDLSGDLDDLLGQSGGHVRGPAAQAPREHPEGLDGFFEDLREERGRGLEGIGAALAYDQASEHFNRGEIESAAACLRTAARDPLFRFRAASMLSRIARDEGRLPEAVEWLERAAEAPAPTAEASHGLLYELGDVLDASDEDARALAVFIELLAASPGYRDVAERIAGLSRRQSGPAGPEKGRT
ncbi:MAG: tetratricopeptide repeat protein [Vicinamibacterales bacterium]